MKSFLCPDPPRRVPAHRLLGVVLRTGHLLAVGVVLGGHVFDVEPARIMPFLVAAILTGAAMMALELASTCAWLFQGKGVAVLLKLGLLVAVPVFWEHRVALLVAATVLAGVGSHMSSRFRHYSFLTGRVVDAPPRALAGPNVPLHLLGVGRRATVTHVEREDADLLRYLAALGLLPETRVEIEEIGALGGPIVVRVGSARYALGQSVAARIRVRPV
jgi:Fe2+ transport system protein FeoA